MKLSIVILNYNTKQHLNKCLQSIKASQDRLKKEVIVVDNASTDGSARLVKKSFPWVRLIALSQNSGYSAGNNAGIKAAKGKLVLLLNSDTEIYPTTLTVMTRYMDQHAGVGVATCKVLLETGELDPASHRGFPTPWASFSYISGLEKVFPRSKLFARYHQGWKDLSQTHEIDTPAGAFYLTRKSILDEVGLLDERFFIYAEDIDLSLRIKQAGHKVMFVPSAKILHHKRVSGRAKSGKHASAQQIRKSTSSHFFTTMKLFYNKHYQDKYSPLTRWLVLSGIWLISKLKS